jgi:hypothetical protein
MLRNQPNRDSRSLPAAQREVERRLPLLGMLALIAFSLVGCPATSRPALKTKRPDPVLPESWKEEPVLLVSDSSLYTFQPDQPKAPLLADHVSWYWINKRIPEVLSPLSVLDFESIESPAQIEVKAIFPDGQIWNKAGNFQRVNVPDEGAASSNRYVQWITMPRYEAGTWLRVQVRRQYHKPNFIPGEQFRQRFPVLSRVLQVTAPDTAALRVGIVNGEGLAIVDSQGVVKPTNRRLWHWRSDTLKAIDPRNPLRDPAAWYATVRFSWPLPNGRASTWQNLGDHYLEMAKSSIATSKSITDFAAQLGDGPKDSLVARAFSGLGKRLRYHADEEKLHAFVPRGADWILKQGYGDCKEMSVLLHLILRERKIESFPALIAIPRSGQAQPDFPSLGSFNHMILAIPDESGRLRFVDPTMGRLPAFRSALQLAGRRVFILQPNGSRLDQVPSGNAPNQEVRTDNTLKEAGSGRWTLEGTVDLSGVGAQALYPQMQNLNGDEKARFLSEYLESVFGIKSIRHSLLVLEPDRIQVQYAADFTDHFVRLEKGGFTLDVPTLFGGRASFTTLDLEGPIELGSTRQVDEWKMPKGFVELEGASTSHRYAKGGWRSQVGKIQRHYEATPSTWGGADSDYRQFLQDRDKLHKATVWQR